MASPVLEYILVDGPPTMSIHSVTGELNWAPALADVGGAFDVEVIVRDDTGLLSEPQRFAVEVVGDPIAPVVDVEPAPDPSRPGDTVTFTVTATDNDAALIEGLTVDGTAVPLDASGMGTWVSTGPGRFDAVATAIDPSGNRGTGTASVLVLDSADTTPPLVELVTPEANDELTYLHDTLGTVRDDNLHRWWLEARPADRGGFRTMLTGTNGVESASLGQLDVTQLRNGIWVLRLRAEDTNGQTSSVQIPVFVDGGAKLGIVHLEFTDLVVEDFGIPIAVNRIYDSRDAEQVGDFGHGWTLDIRQGSIQHNYPAGQGMALFTSTGDPVACQRHQDILGHFAEVRLSDDEWYTFRPILTGVGAISGSCGGDVAYELVDGARPGAELRIVGPRSVRATALNVIGPLGIVTESNLISTEDDTLFEPENFELLLPDGRRFGLNNERGITSITDRNGNSLIVVDGGPFGFGPTGLLHSSGRFVEFVRDPEGRITMIRDEGGRIVEYDYDADGNLVTFTDVLGRDTSYEYNASGHPHHLTDIIDWRGVRMAAIDYQADGRMRELCDADGVCIEQQYDLVGQSMLRFTGLPAPTSYAYDTRGNISLIRDGLGNETHMQYAEPPWNNLVRRTDPDGAVTRYEYRLRSSDLTAVIPPTEAGEDPDLLRTDLSYQIFTHPDTGQILSELESMTLPSGGTIHYEVDARGNQTAIRDDLGNVILSRTVGSQGELLAETDRFGTTTFVYGSGPEPTELIAPDGRVATMFYDAAGNLRFLDDGGEVTHLRHDAAGRDIQYDFGGGTVIDLEYGQGDYWTQFDSPTTTRLRHTTGMGRLTGWTRNGERDLTLEYTAAGQIQRTTSRAGSTVATAYDAAGRVASLTTSPSGTTTTYTRDAVGRPTLVRDALGNETAATYRADGRIESVTDARGHSWTMTYTPTTTALSDPLGHQTTTTTNGYGLPTETTYADGASRTMTYLGSSRMEGAEDRPLTSTDELGRTRSYSYEPHGAMQSASDLGGNSWTYGHPSEFAETVSSPEGRQWLFERPQPGAPLSRIVYPDGSESTMAYTSFAELARLTLGDGTTVSLTYDSEQRLSTRTSTGGDSVTLTYTPLDRIDTITSAAGTTSYSYDSTGRLQRTVGPDGAVLEYTYDLIGRLTAITTRESLTSTARVTSYVYDPAGNLTEVHDPSGGVTTMTYDAAGRRTERSLPNGVVTTWTYDVRDRIAAVTHTGPAGVLAALSYQRAASGEPLRVTREDGSYTLYGYDSAWRVMSEAHHDAAGGLIEEITYTYDADGNRLTATRGGVSESYLYGAGFRLQDVTGGTSQTFGYDGGGRVTSITRDGSTLSLIYDSADQIVGTSTMASSASYAHDGAGHRVRVADAGGTRSYLVGPTVGGFDSPHLVTDSAGATVAAYVYAGEHALRREDAAGGGTYYLRDAMGSVVALVNDSGAAVGAIDYDAFGNVRSATGDGAGVPASTAGDFRFQGMWLDPTGLYHARARAYDPRVGRFTTRDPVLGDHEEPETWNPYALGRNNPNVYRDPLGLFTMIDLNVSAVVQRILDNLPHIARRAIVDELKDQAFDLAGRAVLNAFSSILPAVTGVNLGGAALPNPFAAGNAFEDILTGSVCGFLSDAGGDAGSAVMDRLRLQMNINQRTGEPNSLGAGCSARSAGPVRRLGGTRGNSFPDFVFLSHPVVNQRESLSALRDGDIRSLIVAELKLRRLPGGSSREGRQLRAIARHAANHGTGVVAYVTLRAPTRRRKINFLRRLSAAGGGRVWGSVLSIFQR